MKNEEIKCLRSLLIHLGDEGSSVYARDIDKLVAFAAPRLEPFEKEFSQQFLTTATLQPCKSCVYTALLCRLQTNYPMLVEGIVDGIFSCLCSSFKNGKVLQLKICLELLCEFVRAEILNAFSFIPILMEILAEIEKYLDEGECLITILLDVLLNIRNFLLQRYSMEYNNLIEDFLQVFNKIDSQRKSFQGQLFVKISASTVCEPFKSLFIGKPIRKIFELRLTGKPPTENFLKLFEILHQGEQQSLSLLALHFIQHLRLMIIAYAPNPQLLMEKIIVYESSIDVSLRSSLICDLFIALCGENIPGAKFSGLIMIEKFESQIPDWYEIFNERIARYHYHLQGSSDQLNLNQLELLAFNMAHLQYKNSKAKIFISSSALSGSFKHYYNCFHMELSILKNEDAKKFDGIDKLEYSPPLRLKEIAKIFFESSLSPSMFFSFVSAHTWVFHEKSELYHTLIEAFLLASLKSLYHFKAYLKIYGPFIKENINSYEEYFLEKLFLYAEYSPQKLKFSLLCLISANIVEFEKITIFCLKKLLDQEVSYGKALTDLLKHFSDECYFPAIHKCIMEKENTYISQQLLRDLNKRVEKIR